MTRRATWPPWRGPTCSKCTGPSALHEPARGVPHLCVPCLCAELSGRAAVLEARADEAIDEYHALAEQMERQGDLAEVAELAAKGDAVSGELLRAVKRNVEAIATVGRERAELDAFARQLIAGHYPARWNVPELLFLVSGNQTDFPERGPSSAGAN